MTTVLVNLTGILLIIGIIWWFWLSKVKTLSVNLDKPIEVNVKNGVYQPANIQVKVNQLITLRFIREDASPCAETVVFNSLNVSKQLPLNEPTELSLTLKNPGEYEFTCQMGMYRGKLIAI